MHRMYMYCLPGACVYVVYGDSTTTTDPTATTTTTITTLAAASTTTATATYTYTSFRTAAAAIRRACRRPCAWEASDRQASSVPEAVLVVVVVVCVCVYIYICVYIYERERERDKVCVCGWSERYIRRSVAATAGG